MSLGDLCVALSKSNPERSWTRDVLRNWLINEVYVGMFLWGRWPQGKYHVVQGGEVNPATSGSRRSRRASPPAEGIIRIEGNHPAIVDQDTFDRARLKLPVNRWKTTPHRGGGGWKLSGLLVCGDGGQKLTGCRANHRRGEKLYVYFRYLCSTPGRFGRGKCRMNNTHQDNILTTVASLLKESFSDPERIAVLRRGVEAKAQVAAAAIQKHADGLQKRIARLDTQLEKATKRLAILDDDMVPLVAKQIRDWQAERDRLSSERAELLAAEKEDAACRERIDAALEAIEALEETVTIAPPEKVKDALRPLRTRAWLSSAYLGCGIRYRLGFVS